MESEKSGDGTAVVTFGSAAEADRRVAGVAAAARIVRGLVQEGADRIWLAWPGAGAPARATADDLARLSDQARVELADAEALPGILDRAGANAKLMEAPRLVAADILKATGKPGDGAVSRTLNRPVSRRISGLLLRIPGMRPVYATFGTALLASLMFAALLIGGKTGLIAGGLLFHAASVFDGVDGEIARATFRSSPSGAALDTAVDMTTNLLFIVGLTIGLSGSVGREALIVGGWGLSLFVMGLAALSWRAARATGPFMLDLIKDRYRPSSGRVAPLLMRCLAIVSSRDFFALLFALLILADLPLVVLYVFACAATVWIVFVIASIPSPRDTVPAKRSA